MWIGNSIFNNNNNTEHCKEVAMQLSMKHDRCYLSKKHNDNVSLHLNIDDNYEDLEMLCWVETGKFIENVRDVRQPTIETSRVTMKEKDTLSTFKSMLRRVRVRCNQNENEEEGGTNDVTSNYEFFYKKMW